LRRFEVVPLGAEADPSSRFAEPEHVPLRWNRNMFPKVDRRRFVAASDAESDPGFAEPRARFRPLPSAPWRRGTRPSCSP